LGVVVVAVVVVKIRVLSEVCCREGGGAWILFILRILSFPVFGQDERDGQDGEGKGF